MVLCHHLLKGYNPGSHVCGSSGGGGSFGFGSIFNTTYNINCGSSGGIGGFWGGFGLGIGQAIGGFFSGMMGGFSGMWGGMCNMFGGGFGMGGMFSALDGGFSMLMAGMSNLFQSGPLNFGDAFSNFWTSVNASAPVDTKTNKDTSKIKDFEKKVKALEDKTETEKAEASFKTSVKELYKEIKKAKEESDDIDKTKDDESYDNLMNRLKTLYNAVAPGEDIEAEDPADDDDGGNGGGSINGGGDNGGGGNVRLNGGGGSEEKDSKGNYKISDELKAQGFKGTYCKTVVYKTSEKEHYYLNSDGTVGNKVAPPEGYRIIAVNKGGTFIASKINAERRNGVLYTTDAVLYHNGSIKTVTERKQSGNKRVKVEETSYNENGQKQEYKKYDNNGTQVVQTSTYRYNFPSQGCHIETRKVKDWTNSETTKYYLYTSPNDNHPKECDENGTQTHYENGIPTYSYLVHGNHPRPII